jgi:DNA-binding helix-hairpin-helix protein with protein kinase domain
MSMSPTVIDRRRLKLGARLGKGGEGEVFSLQHDEAHAVKLYTVSDLVEREQKVEAMIRCGMAKQVPQVAFPLAVVRDEFGKFSGFLMRNVLEHKPLHELYSPGPRKSHFPLADYRFLVRTAQNIAKAIASVHAIDCVIGDINQSSILVSKAATVALIDSDSFQVSDSAQQFLCRVGVPEYTPPELQGASLAKIARTPNHDAFGLAIVVFQLLFMGRHPFVGSVRIGEIPALSDSIRDFRFAYTDERDVGMDQPPGTPSLYEFPRSVAHAFESAFGRTDQDSRPSAVTWINILAELEKSLAQCSYEKQHWYPVEAAECPWCVMERELGAMLFVPSDPSERVITQFDPGAGGFNLAATWQQILTFNMQRLSPKLPTTTPSISAAARLAKFMGRSHSDKLRRRYFDVEHQWQAAASAWKQKTGVAAIEDLFEELRVTRSNYESLSAEENAQIEAYARDRRERQLTAFLTQFEVRRTIMKHIGPAEEATLASFGIESAADITPGKLMSVSGLRQEAKSGLVEWRRRLEKRFVYDPKENDVDRQELARIRATIEHQAAHLRRTLLAGRSSLDNAAAHLGDSLTSEDAELTRLHALRLQLAAELEYLGLDTATLAALAVNSNHLAVSGSRVSVSPTKPRVAAEGSMRCPRCGSPMVRRIAKNRGSRGRQFWGCSRHPLCKGTLS